RLRNGVPEAHGRHGSTASDKKRGDESATRPLLLLASPLLADQNVAATKCPPFCRAAVHGNGERVVRAGLAVIGDADGEGSRRTVKGASAIERGRIADN